MTLPMALPCSAILFLLCAIVQDDSQRIECRCLNKLQGVRVVMIERAVAPLHQKLGFNEIGPASVIVKGYVAAVIVRAEGFFQEFGGADSVTRIAALRRDRDFLVIWLRETRCEQDLAPRNCHALQYQAGCGLPKPIADLIVKSNVLLWRVDVDVIE